MIALAQYYWRVKVAESESDVDSAVGFLSDFLENGDLKTGLRLQARGKTALWLVPSFPPRSSPNLANGKAAIFHYV